MKKLLVSCICLFVLFNIGFVCNNYAYTNNDMKYVEKKPNFKSEIDVSALYNWKVLRSKSVVIKGINMVALMLKNPNKKAKPSIVKVFAGVPSGVILAYQYTINGVTRTFELNGGDYVEITKKSGDVYI